MPVLVIIPARKGSTRFPRKPLASISGIPMIQRVWAAARGAANVARVVVATDDVEVEKLILSLGGEALQIQGEFANGTERVRAAADRLEARHFDIINLQGDAALISPHEIGTLAAHNSTRKIVTLCTPLDESTSTSLQASKLKGGAGGVTLVKSQSNAVLYMSRSLIPFKWSDATPLRRHIGLYRFTYDALCDFCALPPGRLEVAENIELLRALEADYGVEAIDVDLRGRTHVSVDYPEDVDFAESVIAREGEPVPLYDGSYRVPV